MKKLLLGLGTISLAILPVAAMVSCSTTTPTLDTEAANLAKEFKAKTATTTTTAAVKSITDAKDAVAKLAALKVLVDVPALAEGFAFEVKSATINSTKPTQVDVKITVTETGSTEATKPTKDVTLLITGLTAGEAVEATLDTEAAKFGSKVTKTPNTTQADALATFTGDDAAAKLAALKVLVDVPTLADGFTFEVKSAAVSGATDLDVKITITKTAGATTKDVTFKVTGLKVTPSGN